MNEIKNITPNYLSVRGSGMSSGNENIRDRTLRDQSRELETVFLTQMIKTMEKTIPGGGITGSGKNSLSGMMFSSVMAQAVSSGGGIGLADMIYQSLADKGEILSDDELSGDSMMHALDYLTTHGKLK